MLRPFLAALLLAFGASQAMAATLTITASGTVTTAVAGIGADVGDSFTLTATVSEPAFSSSPDFATYRLDSATVEIGGATLSLIAPTNSALLEVFSISGRSTVFVRLNPGTFTQPSDSFFANFGAVWQFDQTIGVGLADLAALDFAQASSSSFGAADSRTQGPGVDGTITAESFTLPAVIPLPAAGWLLLAGLGGLALARRRARG